MPKQTLEEFNDCISSDESRMVGAAILLDFMTVGCCIHERINFAALLINSLVKVAPPDLQVEVVKILQEAIELGKRNMKLEDFWGLEKQ